MKKKILSARFMVLPFGIHFFLKKKKTNKQTKKLHTMSILASS